MGKLIKAADLFCGAGGSSTGLTEACKERGYKLRLLAINHWEWAIKTHTANHPEAEHLLTELDSVNPRDVVPDGHLNLLMASPECVYFSVARGGQPIDDQRRAPAWLIIRWLGALDIDNVWIENVPEFAKWGPLVKKVIERTVKLPPAAPLELWLKKTRRYGGTRGEWQRTYKRAVKGQTFGTKQTVKVTVWVPDKKREGEIFNTFIEAIRAHNYNVEWRVLNAADYGAATSRQRLFIIARKGRRKITWPERTHFPLSKIKREEQQPGLFAAPAVIRPYRPAREIIDWSIESESIFGRPRPLAVNTIRRIIAGLRRFCGLPFIVPNFGERNGQRPRTHDLEHPLPTPTGHGAGGLVEPSFIIGAGGPEGAGRPISTDQPMRTVLAENHQALVQSYLVRFNRGQDMQSVEMPIQGLTTRDKHGLAQFCLALRGTNRPHLTDQPISTVCAGGNHHGLCEAHAFMLGQQSGGAPRSVADSVPTIATDGAISLVQSNLLPFIMPTNHGDDLRTHDISQPLPTITSVDAWSVIESFIINITHGGKAGYTYPIDGPVPTLVTQAEHGVVSSYLVRFNGNHNGRQDGDRRVQSLDDPLGTLDTSNRYGFCQPFIVKFFGTGVAQSLGEPLGTITTKDRFGLVIPQWGMVLDIRFRMLQPHELAAAMSFPRNYVFKGTREHQVKQIGNAVEVRQAKALCEALIA